MDYSQNRSLFIIFIVVVILLIVILWLSGPKVTYYHKVKCLQCGEYGCNGCYQPIDNHFTHFTRCTRCKRDKCRGCDTIDKIESNKNESRPSIGSNDRPVNGSESPAQCPHKTITIKKPRGCTHYQPNPDDMRFIHMIPDKPLVINDEVVTYINKFMVDAKIHLNKTIPLGFTFFGQFIDHDMTLNLTNNFGDEVIEVNTRTPHLDLDSVYSLGPKERPEMYDGDYIRLNQAKNDLLRDSKGVAIIGDDRNDENDLIAQIHLIFIRFHNKLVASGLDYETARQEVTWSYQYLVVKDFLFRFCTPALVRKILARKARLFETSALPHEFSVAAFRFGHATIVEDILINDDTKIKLADIFEHGVAEKINWAKFFGPEAQATRLLGPHIAPFLGTLPDKVEKPDDINQNSLAMRNLKRAVQFGLCSGQEVSKYLGIRPLTSKQLEKKFPETKKYRLSKETPLWYYLLAEAAIRGEGKHLGPTGATLITEVILSILKNDSRSYLYARGWKPKHKTFDDLCKYVFA